MTKKTCPHCGGKFKNLKLHLNNFDPEKGCRKPYERKSNILTLDEEEEMVQLTYRNIFWGVNGCLKKLTTGQCKTMQEAGFIYIFHMRGRGQAVRKFTDKGLELWNAIKDEL